MTENDREDDDGDDVEDGSKMTWRTVLIVTQRWVTMRTVLHVILEPSSTSSESGKASSYSIA